MLALYRLAGVYLPLQGLDQGLPDFIILLEFRQY